MTSANPPTSPGSDGGRDLAFDAGHLTRGQRRIALTAVGGYFVDGYDLLVLGGALLAISPELGLGPGEVGILTAAAFVGMAVGSPLSGPLTDRFGRKPIFFTSMVIFVVASLLTLGAGDLWHLVALRLLVGLAIGADMPPSAALITEFIPARRRGTFTALGGVAWMLGGVLAIVLTLAIYGATGGPEHWRWVLATGALPAFVLLVLRHKTPESPYWLRSRGRHDDALAAWRYAQGEHAVEATSSTGTTPGAAPGHGHVDASTAPAGVGTLFRRPFAVLLLVICVYWGFNNLYGSAILLYQPTLITRIVDPGTYTALLFTGTTLLFAAVVGFAMCLWVIESIGRRFIALTCLTVLAVACVLIYVGIGSAAVVLIAFGIAIAVINGGTSLAFYSWAPELFPTSLRGRAVGLTNMVGKAGSVVGTLALPTLYEAIGNAIFLLIAGAALVNLVVVYLLAPETKGRSMAELDAGITHRRAEVTHAGAPR